MATKMTTGLVRLSYLKVARPERNKMQPQQGPRYSVSLLIPKTDKDTLAKANAAITEALDAQFGNKAPPKWKNPLRDGDIDHPDDNAYKGHYFINAWTGEDSPPLLVEGKGKDPVIDKTKWTSGDYGHALINFKGYDQSGSKGVGCYLSGIWFVRKGEALASSASVDDFGTANDNDFEDDDLAA